MRVACDPTGMIVVAAVNIWIADFKVFISVDGCASWTDITPAGIPVNAPNHPRCIDVSDNGQTILFAYRDAVTSRAYLTTNAGVAWTASPVPDCAANTAYTSCAVSASGTRMAISRCWDHNNVPTGNIVLLSSDSGATWSTVPPGSIPTAYSTADRQLRMSASGSVIVVADCGGGAFVSSDYGVTWANVPAPTGAGGQWCACAVVASGAIILLTGSTNAAAFDSISRDFGATWIYETQPIVAAQDASGPRSADADEFGARFVFGTDGNSTPAKQIYRSLPGLVPSGITDTVVLAAITVGGANGSLSVVNGVITAYTPPT
jgi:hypothetical protein